MVKSIKGSKEDSPLVAAKQLYTDQLSGCLVPVIYDGILTLYTSAVEKAEDPGDILMLFQHELKNVPKWNSDVIKTETARIGEICNYFNDLLTAVFVSNVRILSSVKLGSKKAKKVNITVPTNESFVHTVYMETAKKIYTNPYLYSLNTYEPITDNTADVYEVIEKAVLDTIRNLLPLKSILESYLGNTMSDEESDDEEEMDENDEIEEPITDENDNDHDNDHDNDNDNDNEDDVGNETDNQDKELMGNFFDKPPDEDIKEVRVIPKSDKVEEQTEPEQPKKETKFFDDVV